MTDETSAAVAVAGTALAVLLVTRLRRQGAPMRDLRAPAAIRALENATARWPARSKSTDGILGDARHQATNSDHNLGNAVDVTHDQAAGCSGDIIAGHAIADGRARLVIWNRRINSLDERGWRPYTGAHPHTSHVHISIRAERRHETAPWGWIDPSLDEAARRRGAGDPPLARDTWPGGSPYAADDATEISKG